MTVDWQARADEVAAADGDEWDRLRDALERDWTSAYCAAFRSVAKARGWSDETIESGWLDDMPQEAFVLGEWGASPEDAAARDVLECEAQSA